MNRNQSLGVVLAIACILPACEGFTCSQERIKAIELANRGAEEFKNNLYDSAEKDSQAGHPDRSRPTRSPTTTWGRSSRSSGSGTRRSSTFEQAVQRKPDNANYQYDLGEAYLESKKIDEAEKALKAATAADPKLFKAWWRLGLVYKMLDRPKEADDALRHAIEANTRFSKSYVALGYLYLDYDFNKEAAQVFQGCVTAKDDDGECHNGYGLALKNLKQYEQALGRVQEGDRRRSGALRRPLQLPAWPTPIGSTKPTGTTRRTRPASTCRSSSAAAARRPIRTTSRQRTTSSTRSAARRPPIGRHVVGHGSLRSPSPWRAP